MWEIPGHHALSKNDEPREIGCRGGSTPLHTILVQKGCYQ